jgi:hypothetical protein
MNRAKSKGPMESNRGAEPAALVPPVSLANQITDERQNPGSFFPRYIIFEATQEEVTRGYGEKAVLPDDECDDGIRAGIEDMFRRKLSAIRRLPKRERPAARRVATDERIVALLVLRQKQEAARRHRRFLLQLAALKPGS